MARELIVGDVLQEWTSTRRVLERLPDEHLSWKPHEKSMSLGGLSTHVVNLLAWHMFILNGKELDLATIPARREPLTSRAAILEEFDQRYGEVEKAMADIGLDELQEIWTLRRGDHVILSMPRAAALRHFVVSHLIHHRAQLTVYLRLLNIPVPGLYGPSADDEGR